MTLDTILVPFHLVLLVLLGFLLLLLIRTEIRFKNRVISLFFLYYIRRDTGKTGDPILATGFMHQISPPWKRGKGIQVRIKTSVVQIGICKKHHHDGEDSGILAAVGGKYLDSKVEEIREW